MGAGVEFFALSPPRVFEAGEPPVAISHVADVTLASGEQITIHQSSGCHYDVVAREWGFYATSSINGRMSDSGLDVGLVRHVRSSKQFVLVVDRTRRDAFFAYVDEQGLEVVAWLGVSGSPGFHPQSYTSDGASIPHE